MWRALREIARREGCKIHDICSLIHMRKKPDTSLTAAIRVFLMLYYRAAATDEGHMRAGHGNIDKMIRRAHMTRDMLADLKAREKAGHQSPVAVPAAANKGAAVGGGHATAHSL